MAVYHHFSGKFRVKQASHQEYVILPEHLKAGTVRMNYSFTVKNCPCQGNVSYSPSIASLPSSENGETYALTLMVRILGPIPRHLEVTWGLMGESVDATSLP